MWQRETPIQKGNEMTSRQTKWTDFNEQMKKLVNWERVAREVLGLELIGDPRDNGWVKCRSVDGSDQNQSAAYNINTSYSKNF